MSEVANLNNYKKANNEKQESKSVDLELIMAQNKANKERLKLERSQNNKKVLKDYRIKM